MRVILGGQYQSALDAQSVTIARTISDPVPTCTLSLQDASSSIQITEMMEVIVLDDQQIPNPTANLLQNPGFVGSSFYDSPGGALGGNFSFPGTDLEFTVSNAAVGEGFVNQRTQVGLVVPGQQYMFSFTVQGVAPVHLQYYIQINWQDAAGFFISNVFAGFVSPPTSATRVNCTGIAPAGATYIQIQIGAKTTNATNSGTIKYTNAQVEPVWFPTISYPTPFCGPGVVNCRLTPYNYSIRQYRKFGGLVTHVTTGPYVGNVRTLTIAAEGYAWLAATHLYYTQAGFTNQTDAFIINNIVSNVWPAIFSQNHVQTGYTLNQATYQYDDIRSIFDGLCALSGFFWYIDAYYDIWYQPPGSSTMQVALICDNSSVPDLVSTFPAYEFSWETDFTQPCNQATVAGQISGASQAVRVLDPNSQAKYAVNGVPQVFEHFINDTSLQSYPDMVQRGTAEVLQYSGARLLYHLKTNVNVEPGYGVAVTSATDGLDNTTLLIQKVSATWLGTDETLTDVWEYACDLGAYNPNVQNILRNLHHIATATNNGIPPVNQIRLVVVEPQSMTQRKVLH